MTDYIITGQQLESLELIVGDIATNGGENDQRIILAYIRDNPLIEFNTHGCLCGCCLAVECSRYKDESFDKSLENIHDLSTLVKMVEKVVKEDYNVR